MQHYPVGLFVSEPRSHVVTLRYSKEQSTLVLPSESATDFMSWKYNRTPAYVKNNFAKLNVYFEALNYETVEQKKAYEGLK